MKNVKSISDKRKRRAVRIRKKIFDSMRFRLTVFRSNNHFYAQIIDDRNAKTLLSANDTHLKEGTKTKRAEEVGKLLSQKAMKKKIAEVTFDKGAYKYHGRVKVFAESARKGGLTF